MTGPSIETLESGLRKAHLAGDTNAAKTFAKAIQEQRSRDALPKNGSALNSLANGITFGFADEIVGGVNAGIGTFDPALEGTTFAGRYKANRDAVRGDLNAFRERDPATAMAAEIAGGMATGGVGAGRVAAAKTPGLLSNVLKNTGSAAAFGGTFSLGDSEADTAEGLLRDTGRGVAIGGLTGGGFTTTGLLGRAALKKAIKPTNSKAHDKAVGLLESEGVPLTTGQKSGSDRVRSVETNFSESILGPRLEGTFNRQREVLQSSLMKKAGFDDLDVQQGLISDEAIQAAQNKFSERYSSALNNVRVKLDNDKFINTLAQVEAKHQRFLPSQQKPEVSKLLNELIEEGADPDGITGKTYQSIRSRLGKRERALQANDPSLANFFSDMKKALDDSFLDSVDDLTGQRKKNIDKEFARFKQIEKVFNRGGSSELENGLLPIASLNRESKKRAGDKEWRGLLSSAAKVLPDKVPNSGTAGRMLNQALPFGLASKALQGPLVVPLLGDQLLSRGAAGNIGKQLSPQGFRRLNQAGLLAVPSTDVAAR